MPLNSSAPPGVATPARPARHGLILAILATASFIAVLDLYIANVPSKPGPDSPQQPKTVADRFLGLLNN
ncbi:hypothetical protein [Streptomyces scabiei]|uniref:hypothetical protein n=1 Tax=Streptomyces scabiei TaxID=1930 RepID=UPI000AB3F2A9|nr:hypothetical protein [Streptomyces scabiei]